MNKLFSFVVISLTIALFSCNCDKTNKVVVDSPVNALLAENVNLQYEFDLKQHSDNNWTVDLYNKNFTQEVISKFENGVVTLNNPTYNDTAMPVGNLRERLNMDAGVMDETIKVNKEDIVGLFFDEEWFFDVNNFSFNKKVKSWCPVYGFVRNDELQKRKVFQVNNIEEKRENVKLLAKNVISEFSLFNESISDMVNFNDPVTALSNIQEWGWGRERIKELNADIFINSLLNKALASEIMCYDAFNIDQLLTVSDIETKFDAGVDTIWFSNPVTGEDIMEVMEFGIIPEEVKGIIFIEDWYYNEETYQIEKVVKGLAPVRHFYRNIDGLETSIEKRIVFVTYFTDEKVKLFD